MCNVLKVTYSSKTILCFLLFFWIKKNKLYTFTTCWKKMNFIFLLEMTQEFRTSSLSSYGIFQVLFATVVSSCSFPRTILQYFCVSSLNYINHLQSLSSSSTVSLYCAVKKVVNITFLFITCHIHIFPCHHWTPTKSDFLYLLNLSVSPAHFILTNSMFGVMIMKCTHHLDVWYKNYKLDYINKLDLICFNRSGTGNIGAWYLHTDWNHLTSKRDKMAKMK